MPKCILVAPHGHRFLSDVIAVPVLRAIIQHLEDWNIRHEWYINEAPRSEGDMNRPWTRGTEFRNVVDEAFSRGADLVVDVHSFPASTKTMPFRGMDMVVLDRYRVQEDLPEMYCSLLQMHDRINGLKIGMGGTHLENDIVKRAYEFGIPAVLVEHNECGPAGLYGFLNACAIRALL
jgi:hypothetical protein